MVVEEVVHVVEGLEGDWEGGLEEGRVAGQVEAQGAGGGALGPGFLQAYQEAAKMEGHLKMTEHVLQIRGP